MVKETIILTTITVITFANPPKVLEEMCLNCHTQQKIPSELIYRRYLLKYSTYNNMKEKLLNYLKNPKREASIMPKQFFLRFTIKKRLDINSSLLEKGVDEYLKYFDVKSRFELE